MNNEISFDPKTLPERFFAKIDFTDTCWLWKACTNECGYGKLFLKKKSVLAHRFCWSHFNGEIPKELCVLHRCDIRNCVNPNHLFLGTHKENMRDMINKGRKVLQKGDKNPNSKLTSVDVNEIRKLFQAGNTGSEIAKKFGVKRDTIYHIIHKRNWNTGSKSILGSAENE